MSCPRILFIAPSCYPVYGAEANVNAKLLKVLSDDGVIIDLVSRIPRKDLKAYPESTNNVFFSRLESIHLVQDKAGYNLPTIIRHLKTFLKTGFVYKGADWVWSALSICEKLVKSHKYDFIYTFNQPSEIIGLYITKKYGIPWVATWNDPYSWKKYPSPYGNGPKARLSFLRERLIRSIGKHCYRHIFPTDRLMHYMQQYMPNITGNNAVICPHIMLTKPLRRSQNTSRNKLKFIHSGALGKERNPLTLLKAIEAFLIEHDKKADIEFMFLGVFERMDNSEIIQFVNSTCLREYVRFCPPVTYERSLSILCDYDVCIILEANCEEGIFLPSKVADYMQSDMPIFTISPNNGVLNDLYKKGYIDYFASNNCISSIKETIDVIYTNYKNGKISLDTNSAYTQFGKDAILETHKRYIWQ